MAAPAAPAPSFGRPSDTGTALPGTACLVEPCNPAAALTEETSMRALACVALVVVSSGAPLAAQDTTARGAPGRFCLRARPKPECSGFALTNAGVYVVFGDNRGGETALRGLLDYGFMANLNPRDAVGGSVFASLDRDGVAVGPSIRYRRWLTPTSSLEVALGKPVAGREGRSSDSRSGVPITGLRSRRGRSSSANRFADRAHAPSNHGGDSRSGPKSARCPGSWSPAPPASRSWRFSPSC